MAPLGSSTIRRLRNRILLSEDERREQARNDIPPLPPAPKPAVIAAALPTATARSALFRKLPAELRERVLIEAFGDELVHMHLCLDRPLLRKYRPGGSQAAKVARDKRHAGIPPRYAWDEEAPAYWQWRSSSCHSYCFNHSAWRDNPPRWQDNFMGEDDCVTSGHCSCYSEGDTPRKCFLGITGWLLSCRQAYLEGRDVLYRTNTIRLFGTFMFSQLPVLLPSTILENLTSVSLFWDLGWKQNRRVVRRIGDHPEYFTGWTDFQDLLARLPKTLPRVKNLHLSISAMFFPNVQGQAYGSRSEAVYNLAELLFQHVLAQVMRMPKLADLRLALPKSLYMPWLQERLDVTVEYDEAIWAELPAKWIWQGVDVDKYQDIKERSAIKGFWVFDGVSDLPPHLIPCFGT